MKDVLTSAERKLFTVISTFAGGGGSSTGYKLAGGNVLVVNEFVDAAVDTYKENYPDTPVIKDDIKKLVYWVDVYDVYKNVVIEYYEKHHSTPKWKEKDKKRMKNIIEALKCKFIIVHFNKLIEIWD
jgi:site-specific DNA-cytosine methylase